jgi:hypothetical protein
MFAQPRCFLLLLLGLGMSVFAPIYAIGQETPLLIPVTVEPSKQPLGPVILRPHALTTVGFNLKNPTEDNMRGVLVKLVDVGNNNHILVQKVIDKIAPKGEARLVFAQPKEEKKPKDGDKEKDKDKDDGDKIELTGAPTFQLQLWIETTDPKDLVIKRDVALIVREPKDYVQATANFDNEKRRLSFKVKYINNEQPSGPHKCPIKLVLGPELTAPVKKGPYSQVLTKPGEVVELYADNLAFTSPLIREGRVYLNVDGYERAFAYPVTLAGSGDIDPVALGGTVGARIVVPRYTKASPKFPVPIEMDGPLATNYRVEVGIDRAGAKEQFQTVNFPGLRQQKVRLSYAPSGDLHFYADVRDWQAEYDTRGIFGNFWLRVSVFKKDELIELTIPKEVRPDIAEQEPGTDSKRVFAMVNQDESSPEGVAFVDLPKEWRLFKPLLVQARIRAREEHQAPIDTVTFIKGKLPADGKIDPEAVLGVSEFDPKRNEALLQLPAQEEVSALEMTVVFTTKTGARAAKMGKVLFKDYSTKGICTIKGSLMVGQLGQPGRPITLFDAGGAPKDVVKTDAKGNYAFEKVPPGNYTISAQMNYPARAGATKVQVPPNVELIDKVGVTMISK